MGCEPCFCCFRRQSPNCMALTGLIASIFSFAFLIWGLADLSYYRKGAEAIFIIAFIFVVFCLLSFIIIFIILNLRGGATNYCLNNFGKNLCLIILVLCFISFVFLLAHWLVELVDYADLEKDLGSGRQIPRHDWAAVFVPDFVSFIALIFMALAANILYKVFKERLLDSTNQNSTIPNINSQQNMTQPGPPMAPNNAGFPVIIQQNANK